MEDGSLYPSIYLKTHGQPCLFIRNFHKTQASNSIPAHQGSASPTVTPMQSSSVGVPPKKDSAIDPPYISLITLMAVAPLNRGIGNCFARTVRNEGIISLWKGNTAHMMGFITIKFIRYDIAEHVWSLYKNKKEKNSLGKQVAELLAADCLFRAAALFLAHPLAYAKTRMANDISTKSNIEKRQFNGIIDVFRKTLKSDGIAGLYHGYNMAYVACFVSDVPILVLKQKWLLEMLGLQHNTVDATLIAFGLLPFANLITYPMHTVVHRMMMRSGDSIKYKSSSDAFSQILKNEGVRYLYKGASAQIIRFVVGAILSLFLITLKRNRAGRSGQPTNSIDIKWKNGEDGGQSNF
ncbi:hypothetical protein ACOSQ4_012127 [Xanthoceras sorbifolium]